MGLEAFSVTSFGPIGSDSSLESGAGGRRTFRADLHVHSRYSGPAHLRAPGLRGGVGDPEAIYREAKARGMNLVTLTDLDSIDGCLEFLGRHPDAPDFVISEEVTARDPRTGLDLHVLVFDIDEARHRELQRLRDDVRDLAGYARREGLLASLSRLGGAAVAGGPAVADLEPIVALFDRFEFRNGTFGRLHDDLSARLIQMAAGNRSIGVTAGSGAHGPARVGRTTTASNASTPARFLEDLRSCRTWAAGEEGSVWASSADLSRLVAQEYRSLGRPAADDVSRRKGTLARTLLALPLHLVGTPFWGHGLQSARDLRRLRREHRRLDRLDREAFQARARSYSSDPNNRSARWVLTKEEC